LRTRAPTGLKARKTRRATWVFVALTRWAARMDGTQPSLAALAMRARSGMLRN
jgi:hypothetical protein